MWANFSSRVSSAKPRKQLLTSFPSSISSRICFGRIASPSIKKSRSSLKKKLNVGFRIGHIFSARSMNA